MSLFVPVSEPDEIRKELLNNSRMLISCLRRYEHYRELRKAKLESFHELAVIWNDVARLQRKLRAALPKTDVKAPPVSKVAPKPVPIPAQKKDQAPKPVVREQKSRVQLLEEQLSKIEGKLSQLQ